MHSRNMTSGLTELVGKTIAGVVVKEGGSGPHGQLFIVCSDNTYYEIFSGYSPIEGSSHMIAGGMDEAKASVDEADITCEVADTILGSRPVLAR
jgi:hypothetical protein